MWWQLLAEGQTSPAAHAAAGADATFLSNWLHVDADTAAKLVSGGQAAGAGNQPQPAAAAGQGAAPEKGAPTKEGELLSAGSAVAPPGHARLCAGQCDRSHAGPFPTGEPLGSYTGSWRPGLNLAACHCPPPCHAALDTSFLASWLHIDAEAAAKLVNKAGAAAPGTAPQSAAAQEQAAPQPAAAKTGAALAALGSAGLLHASVAWRHTVCIEGTRKFPAALPPEGCSPPVGSLVQ